jgi:hypothetical protein
MLDRLGHRSRLRRRSIRNLPLGKLLRLLPRRLELRMLCRLLLHGPILDLRLYSRALLWLRMQLGRHLSRGHRAPMIRLNPARLVGLVAASRQRGILTRSQWAALLGSGLVMQSRLVTQSGLIASGRWRHRAHITISYKRLA